MSDIPNQIVVVTEHLPLVQGALAAHGLEREDGTRHNRRLGLTLVDLPDDQAVAAVAGRLWEDRRPGHDDRLTEPRADGAAVDRLLAGLRGWFGSRYEGWAPTMGKNRLLNGVELLPYASVHGDDRPEPADPPDGLAAARATWPATPGAHPVQVGVIDTRVVAHDRLLGGYLVAPDGLDVEAPAGGRQWWQGHATFVANLVLTQAPTALLDMRAGFDGVDGDADGRSRMRLWSFAERLEQFAGSGVQVLNVSMGCATDDGRPPLVLERAVARLTSGMVVVAAAGNHGAAVAGATGYDGPDRPQTPGAPMFPAALDGVLAVGAFADGREAARFNPRGADEDSCAPWIDVFAPGTRVVSAYLGDARGEMVRMPPPKPGEEDHLPQRRFTGWARWSGTSFSAATMSGVLAAKIAAGKSPAEAEDEVRCDPTFQAVAPAGSV